MKNLLALPVSGGLVALAVSALVTLGVLGLGVILSLLVIAPLVGVIVAMAMMIPPVLLLGAFGWPVKRFGGTLLKFNSVAKNHSLILRWKFQQSGQREDKYLDFREGLVLYSPWCFAVEATLNLEPMIIPQKGDQVNVSDGALVEVDTQVTAKIIDPIAFLISIGADREKGKPIVAEYLHEALQYATSEDDSDDTRFASTELAKNHKDTLKEVGKEATDRINERLDEQGFGLDVKIAVTAFKAPKLIAAAQEAAAAAKQESDEKIAQSVGMAVAIKNMSKAPAEALTETIGEDAVKAMRLAIADPNTDPEVKKLALSVLDKATPNATVLLGITALSQVLVDAFQQVAGGKRSASSTETKSKPSEDKKSDKK